MVLNGNLEGNKMKNTGKLIILRGLPASGKSTKANELLDDSVDLKLFRVNKSELRRMLWPNHIWSKEYEKIIQKIEYNIVSSFIYNNWNVIIDSTNLKQRDITRWKRLTKNIEIIDCRDTPLEICLKRDNKRKENACGPEIIIKLARENGLLK